MGLGVYAGGGDPSAVSDFASSVGKPRYAMDFLDGTSWSTITESGWPYSVWAGKGYSMIWGVDMLPNTYSPNSNASASGGSCHGLSQEAAGDFNSDFVTVAKNMVAAGFGSSIIRLGWEFNGGWFPWAAGGCSSAFVGAFQQVVTSMRSVAGQSFTFEWNPTRGDLSVGNLATFYPGDSYVDYVGLDVYDVEWASYPGMPSEFSNMETQTYGLNWLSSFASQHNKAMAFPEWGLGWGTCSSDGQAVTASNTQVCGGDDAQFINLSSEWFATHNVAEATYWDDGSSSIDGGSNPNTAALTPISADPPVPPVLASLSSFPGPPPPRCSARIVTPRGLRVGPPRALAVSGWEPGGATRFVADGPVITQRSSPDGASTGAPGPPRSRVWASRRAGARSGLIEPAADGSAQGEKAPEHLRESAVAQEGPCDPEEEEAHDRHDQ